MEKNSKFLFILSICWAIAIIIAFGTVSIVDNKIFGNQRNVRVLHAPRKTIVDCHNNILAVSRKSGRHYPYGEVTVHPVGFVDPEKGLGGEIESRFSPQLTGSDRFRWIFFTGNEDIVNAKFVSSLDIEVQKAAHAALGDMKGAVIVMNAKTGELIAMVSKPDFSPHAKAAEWKRLNNDEKNSPLVNRATTGLYEPGSIIKLVTYYLLLKKPDQSFFCNGSYPVGGRYLRCSHAHGAVTGLDHALQVSCNGYFLHRALHEIPEQDFYDVIDKFSEDAKSGKRSRGEYVLNLIGQGNLRFTPMESILLAGAIANGGSVALPTWQKGSSKKSLALFDADSSKRLRGAMSKVVTGGTGRRLADFVRQGYIVGVKTGTAEKVQANSKMTNIAWAVGFAGIKSPDYVFTVVIEETEGFAAETAVPVASRVLQSLLMSIKKGGVA